MQTPIHVLHQRKIPHRIRLKVRQIERGHHHDDHLRQRIADRLDRAAAHVAVHGDHQQRRYVRHQQQQEQPIDVEENALPALRLLTDAHIADPRLLHVEMVGDASELRPLGGWFASAEQHLRFGRLVGWLLREFRFI